MPGVDAPKNPEPVPSATIAVRAVMAHLDEYTPKQQRAIRRLLEPGPDAVTVGGPPVAPAGESPAADAVTVARIAEPPDPRLVREVERTKEVFRQQYAQRLGFDLPGDIRVHVDVPPDPEHPAWGGWTVPHLTNGTYDGCDISFRPAKYIGGRYYALALAHEVFHCFQGAVLNGQRVPAWLLDGSAEYAASEVTNTQSSWWRVYLTEPATPLFTRAYDALGFYAHLQETVINPYSVMPAMWRAGSNDAAFAAAGARSNVFLWSWASGYARGAIPGTAWDMTGPGITTDKPKPVKLTVPKDGETPLEIAEAYSNQIYELKIDADIVEVKAEGNVRISDGSTDVTEPSGVQFCTRKGGCACAGESESQPPPMPLKKRAWLGLTGGLIGSNVVLTGQSLAQRCCAEPVKPTTAEGLKITPVATCQRIGMFIDKDEGLKLSIGFALYVDHPRLVPQVTKKGVVAGVELQGITGLVLDFGAGVASSSENKNIKVDVPLEIEVPVQPPAKGLPRSMKVRWSIHIKTALTGNNSTLIARGRYALAGPLRVRNGTVTGPAPSVEESLTNSISGITLGPSGIVIAVKTKFSDGAGAPAAMKGTFAALTASFGVTNGSSLGAPLARCHGASLDLVLAGGKGKAAAKKKFFNAKEIVPDVPLCEGTL